MGTEGSRGYQRVIPCSDWDLGVSSAQSKADHHLFGGKFDSVFAGEEGRKGKAKEEEEDRLAKLQEQLAAMQEQLKELQKK